MAYSVNKAVVLGRLGQDPDTRYSQSGTPITTFSVATSRRWRDQRTEEWREETEWHNIVCFGRTAEIASEYLRKGMQCYVEGDLRTSNWERDGVRHYKTEINVRDLVLLDRDSQSRPPPGDTYRNAPPRGGRANEENDAGRERRSNRPQEHRDTSPEHEIDDDIPF